MKAYPKYKDSGIEWIGEMPAQWRVQLLGSTSTLTVPMRDKPRVFDGEIPWVRIEDFNGKYISDSKSEQRVSSDIVKEMNLKVYPLGTVLCSCSCTMGATAIVARPLVSNQTFIGISPLIPLFSDYLYYLMQAASDWLTSLASGSIQQYLSRNLFSRLRIPLPEMSEQQSIATYLDRKTKQIDGLIDKKQNQIDLLREQRTAVINEAVTKGLNPKAKMKDSGIEWIGEIPAHWSVTKLKFHADKIGSGVTPRGGAEVYVDSGVPLLRSQNVHFDGLKLDDVAYIEKETHESMSGSAVQPDDVLINITGASVGRCAYVPKSLSVANVNQHVCIIRSSGAIKPQYLNFFLSSDLGQHQVLIGLTGAAREGLTNNQLGNFTLLLPNVEEQLQIMSYLENITSEFDTMITKEERLIELLKWSPKTGQVCKL